jgi:hypothetical protein
MEEIEEHSIADTGHNSIQQQMEETLAELRQRVASIDLASVAQRLGAENTAAGNVMSRTFIVQSFTENSGEQTAAAKTAASQNQVDENLAVKTKDVQNSTRQNPNTDRITIRCLGKNFTVDKNGNIETDIHVNPWLAIPILNYIIDGKGVPLSNKWVSFRDLPNGRSRYPLFARRCEDSLRKLADTYTNLFEDMLEVFDGKQLSFHYPCDIVVALYPLPLVPVLICYLKPEDDLESELKIFVDANSEENLDIESIYKLVAGIVMMFEKLAIRHS